MTTRRGVCLVISAPSGAGKSTITRALLASDPALRLSVSATTRAPRPGEVEGVHYFFRTADAFATMVAAVASCWNGPRCSAAATARRARPWSRPSPTGGTSCSTSIGRAIACLRAALPGDVVSVFVLPPSLTALEQRLARPGRRRRGGDRAAHAGRP